MSSSMPSQDEVLGWMKTLSNWGRWGEDDRLGTLNLVTPEKRRAAAATISEGITVSCGWDILNGRNPGNHYETQRHMLATGVGVDSGRESRYIMGRMAAAAEFIGIAFHGFGITHLDALSHLFWDSVMYNGRPSSLVDEHAGAGYHDVLAAAGGIQSRGILLDIAALHGVEWLKGPVPVMPGDLEAAEQRAGVRVEPGDILLVRTGEGARKRSLGADWLPDNGAGLHAACLPWLHERGVAALGADVGQDLKPSGYDLLPIPIHIVGIVAMGLWLMDNCQLEELSQTCARLSRWEFLFTAAPLRIEGGTGGPLNPIATF